MSTVIETKERPIIFSAPMVRAILEGRKTQTRRIDRRQNYEPYSGVEDGVPWFMDEAGMSHDRPCPYGKPGDRLWVREAWRVHKNYDSLSARLVLVAMGGDTQGCIGYKGSRHERFWGAWRSPLFMPRWASRITLEITDVRVHRVQEISEEDAKAEGCDPDTSAFIETWNCNALGRMCRDGYRVVWDKINGTGSWESNPWVWAISFRRIDE